MAVRGGASYKTKDTVAIALSSAVKCKRMAHQHENADEDEWEGKIDSDPNEESDLDELEEEDEDEDEEYLKPLRYSGEYPSLPANRPAGYPRIIDLRGFDEEVDKSDLRCADGVATLLWKWKPDEFQKFFDLSNSSYELSRVAPGDMIQDMIMARKERLVIVSLCSN